MRQQRRGAVAGWRKLPRSRSVIYDQEAFSSWRGPIEVRPRQAQDYTPGPCQFERAFCVLKGTTMAWAEIDNHFYDHPKIIAAGSLGVALFACGLSYCSRHLTGGFIPMAQIQRLIDTDNPQAIAERLVAVGLWERQRTGYLITDAIRWRFRSDLDNQELRKTARYKKWRMAVLQRDENICLQCGSTENLHVHHIKEWALHPNERLSIKNGETLCKVCHSEIHGRRLYVIA